MVFSFVGYTTQEVTVGSQTTINVTLSEDSELLEEVVVVGYGEMRKSDITGSVASVSVADNVARQSLTADQMLQGRAAGVQVTANNANPGSGISVRIRGGSSLRANNEPLYVVDGVIISSAGEDAVGIGNDIQSNQNGLNGINPRDIESMEVLKDASATAIYGSRGANGVILITTKKGKAGQSTVNGYVTSSISRISKKLDVLDGLNYARYQNERRLANGWDVTYQIDGGNVYPILADDDGNRYVVPDASTIVDWQDEIYKDGISYNAGGSVSTGTETGNYYISVGVNDQNGIVDNSRYRTGDFRINLNQKITDKLQLETRFSGFFASGEFAQGGSRSGGNGSFIYSILAYNPLISADIDNLELMEELEVSNPYSWIRDFEDLSKENRFIGSLGLTYELPLEGLSFQVQAGGNLRNKGRKRFFGLTTSRGRDTNGQLGISERRDQSFNINNLLTYNKSINKMHRINAVVGVTWDQRYIENDTYEVNNFSTPTFTSRQPYFAQTVTNPLRTIITEERMLSYLGRVNYTLMNKYILTSSFRVDGSSKFAEGNKYGIFPSFALAWRMSQEDFINSIEAVDDLKLRIGWGRIGNQGIPPYQTLAIYGPTIYATPSNGTTIGFIPTNLQNPDLRWETTQQLNVGVDFSLFKSVLMGTIEVYDKTTFDLLQNAPLPTSVGFGRWDINWGEFNNKGLEVTLNSMVFDKNDLQIEIGGNIAFNKSNVVEIGDEEETILFNGTYQSKTFYRGDVVGGGAYFKYPANFFIEGEEVGLFYGYKTDGIYQTGDEITVNGFQEGDVRIIDQNGDGEIDVDDATIIGNPNPDFVYGMTLSASYKRFTANVLFSGIYGNDIANGQTVRLAHTADGEQNKLAVAFHEAWRPDAPSTTHPRIGYNKENGSKALVDRNIEDGSFMRLSNITIGYDIPIEKVFNRCNVYVSGINLLTFTKYSGYDPEVTSFMGNGNIRGVDYNGLPNVRTVLVGLNINF